MKKIMLYSNCYFTQYGFKHAIDSHPQLAKDVEITYSKLIPELNRNDILILAIEQGQNIAQMIMWLGNVSYLGLNIILIVSQGKDTRVIRYLDEMTNARAVLDKRIPVEVLQNFLLYILENPMAPRPFAGKKVTRPLSNREVTVINALLSGKNTYQIAKELGIHYKTVSAHKRTALCKLGMRSLQPLINVSTPMI